MSLDFALEALNKILAVLPTTLMLFIFSVLLGLVFALIVLWMRMSSNRLLSGIAKTYIFIFRGTPLLIQIFLIFYGLAQFQFMKESWFWLVLKNRIASAVFVMALCTAAYQAEILRGGLLAVSTKEIEAARAIGMSGFKLLYRIIAPIALRQALPAYSTEVILTLKSTSLAGLIGVVEMTGIAQKIGRQALLDVPVLALAGIIYIALSYVIIFLLGLAERQLSPHLRFMPPSAQTPRTIVG
ncbi:ABC transporter permease subunit [Labrys sp. LIt4]|uniref:ABC transporter permease n=1 Tax=Labrys sp. LIt4 TaxID=2821355 RepID=UPI001AE02F80|nr:ABC transporter permease subunit [Labrys sp. LIt4]MBP0581605.1 ABC transporter permease subunit [Labrys sp. LIt4]